MYVLGYLQGSENGRVVTIDHCTQKTKTYGAGIPSPCLEQTQTYGGIKPFKRITTFPLS